MTSDKEMLIARISDGFAAATAENPAFGTSSKRIFAWLGEYEAGSPIPESFWVDYSRLLKTVEINAAGTYTPTKAQAEVLNWISNFMRTKNLIIKLPPLDEFKERLHLVVVESCSFWEFIEKEIFPVLLEKSGQEMDVSFFLSLMAKMLKVGSEKAEQPVYAPMLAELQYLPDRLIDTFISNQYLAKYAHEQFEMARKSDWDSME